MVQRTQMRLDGGVAAIRSVAFVFAENEKSPALPPPPSTARTINVSQMSLSDTECGTSRHSSRCLEVGGKVECVLDEKGGEKK